MLVRVVERSDPFEVGEDLSDPIEASQPNSLQSGASVLGAGEAQRLGGDIGLARSERATK